MIIKRKITTLTTDVNGQASYRYDSTGIGDVTFGVGFEDDDSILLTKTFSIEDCVKYVASDSITTVTGGVLTNKYYSVSASTDYVVTAKLKSTLGKGFALTFSQYTNSHDYTARTGATNSGYKYAGVNSGSDDNTITQNPYTANTDISFKIERNGTTANLYIDGTLIKTKSNVSWLSNATYVRVDGWNPDTAQTITFTDLKVKPL